MHYWMACRHMGTFHTLTHAIADIPSDRALEVMRKIEGEVSILKIARIVVGM